MDDIHVSSKEIDKDSCFAIRITKTLTYTVGKNSNNCTRYDIIDTFTFNCPSKEHPILVLLLSLIFIRLIRFVSHPSIIEAFFNNS